MPPPGRRSSVVNFRRVVCVTIARRHVPVAALWALSSRMPPDRPCFHFLHGQPQISEVSTLRANLLRVGVALLGARITVDQVAHPA
jgi:hypothetical protein